MRITIRVIVILILILGLAEWAPAQWPLGKMPPTTVEAKPGPNLTVTGRFQVFISPHIKDQTFMLDTDTGRVWIIKKDHSTGNFSWKRIPVDEVDDKVKGKTVTSKP